MSKVVFVEKEATFNVSITVPAGSITVVNVCDQPMYWYNNTWHPYPKGDFITFVGNDQ